MNKKMITALTVAGFATVAMATTASADSYTVKSGDTLSKIALDNSTTIAKLVADNQIANANLIFVGQELAINEEATAAPVVQAPVAATTNAVSYNAPVAAPVVETAPVVATAAAPVEPAVQAPVVAQAAPVESAAPAAPVVQTPAPAASGSTYDQFIAAGGTDAMWTAIVMPESGGNVNATNGQYHGLGQTNQSWGYGSVAQQTAGMLNYAVERYGSIDNAIAFRAANNWW